MATKLLLFSYSYSDRDQLQTVYSAYLTPVLHHDLRSHPVWGSTARVHSLAGSMVSLYEQVQINILLKVPTWAFKQSLDIYSVHIKSFDVVIVLHM